MISDEQFLARVRGISVWKRGDQRAPHKPLLLLLALGRFSQGRAELSFSEVCVVLKDLLREFGPSRSVTHPEYPFIRLKSDALWEVIPEGLSRQTRPSTDPTARNLLDANAVGRFPPDIRELLLSKPNLISFAADIILASHFPNSIHDDIRNACGLPLYVQSLPNRVRSSRFRRDVLISYGYACAICGFSLRLNDATVGIDAAHIRWFQADGPDSADNGLALCVLHHKLFDLGAFTLAEDATVLVSERVAGGPHLRSSLLSFHGNRINMPARPEHAPNRDFIAWHRAQVFKERHLPLMAL